MCWCMSGVGEKKDLYGVVKVFFLCGVWLAAAVVKGDD